MGARAKARARAAGALLALTLVPRGGAVAAAPSLLCFDDTAGAQEGEDGSLRRAEVRPPEVPEVGARRERTCADVDALVRDVVSDARARGADAPDVPEDLARRCACAAAAFVCRQHEEVSRGLARDPTSRVTAARDARRLCAPPCEIDLDVPDGVCDAPDPRAETEAACLGPVCQDLCAPCVTEAAAAAPAAHDHDIPFDLVHAACGDERACLCAQCLDAALLERNPTDDAGRWGGGGSYYGYFGYPPAYLGNSYAYVGSSYGYGPGPGQGYGSSYRPVGGGGGGGYPYPNPYPGPYPYPAGYYPGYGYKVPWHVAVYDKVKAWIASSLCYWHPYYPACRPPPLRPIDPPPGAPPRPGAASPPPPPILGAPPSPSGGNTCGDPSLGELTCSGIPCTGEATCTTTDPQCCCDASCFEFGDCCADRDACCGGAQGYAAAVIRGGARRDAPFGGESRRVSGRKPAEAAESESPSGSAARARHAVDARAAASEWAPHEWAPHAASQSAATSGVTVADRFALADRPDDEPFADFFAPAPGPSDARVDLDSSLDLVDANAFDD